VKLSAIALDYDGTIARDDVLDPSIRDAIAAARSRGIVVLLVTGRILEELRRVAGEHDDACCSAISKMAVSFRSPFADAMSW
jgi:hydroxymethylpyrimidine pyrophosphatase-like HAD family hydrolase